MTRGTYVRAGFGQGKKGRLQFLKHRCLWWGNIQMDHTNIGRENLDWKYLSLDTKKFGLL